MRERGFVRAGMFVAIVTASVWAFGSPALAQETYVGASYLSTDGEFNATGNSFSDSSDGFKIFGGYQFAPHWAAEVSYYDLGDYEDVQGATTFRADADAWDLAFRGIVPIGERFEVFGKLGYSTVNVDISVAGPLATTTVDSSDWEFFYGVGVGLKIGEKFGIRAEWEAWDVEGKLEEWSVGAYFRFGRH